MKLQLELHEKQSALVQKIRAHLDARLTSLRTKNDSSLPTAETEKLRGRILEIKQLLNEMAEKPLFEIELDDTDAYRIY